ncbi:MAG: FliA/WhiG family RNA polymerase sigma factor [Planctomycetota bacterium]
MNSIKTLYTQTRDKETIDKMVTDYLPLVRYIVGRIPVRVSPIMDQEDMMSVGVLGLINAAKTFDPDRGASFKTYAYTNIKGSILDELRRHDSVPRSIRDKMKKVDEVADRLIEKNGTVPTPDEIAAEMGITVKALDDLLLAARTTAIFSINDSDPRSGEVNGILDSIADLQARTPEKIVEQSEIKSLLVKAIKRLPETERQVVFLYYNKNMLLKEIGAVLDVSESRICQILGRAHFLLKKEITNMGG